MLWQSNVELVEAVRHWLKQAAAHAVPCRRAMRAAPCRAVPCRAVPSLCSTGWHGIAYRCAAVRSLPAACTAPHCSRPRGYSC